MNYCYNTDPQLWANYFRSSPNANMRYVDGVVYNADKPEEGALARFDSNDAAIKAMTVARQLAAE